MTNSDAQISELRDVVRKLKPTGVDGFEGLMAAVLTAITKTTFSLAKSGSQGGIDGQSTLNCGAISFEGKLYDRDVPKNEVLSKIAEVAANDNGDTDLWIVGSTGTISSQDIKKIQALGERVAIGTLILDWSTTGLPPFAALLGMAPATTASFLASKTGTTEAEILAKLDVVRRHSQFADRVQDLTTAIEQPSIGPAYALKQNEEFLRTAFDSTRKARAVFGQPLAPGDTTRPVLDRVVLRQSLAKVVFGKPNGQTAAVLGTDGVGKSWLFAQAWQHQSSKPLTIILVPDNIEPPFALASLEELLISNLIIQTGDTATEISRRRWRKHFERWKRAKNPERPRLVVFIDGLNQCESIDWSKFINTFSLAMADMGGKLVFSCRTPFYRNNLKNRLTDPVEPVDVREWTNPELEQLLHNRGTSIANLKPAVVNFLRNPRIFAVAEELFQDRKIEGFTELSVSRLLFEHILRGASPAAERLPVDNFVQRVRDHANKIIERLTQTEMTDLKVFERPSGETLSDQLAIISAGRFFEEVPGNATLYRLKDDSTPLALGLSLLNTAQRAHRNGLDIAGELSSILDPISALDNTAEVLISALIAAVLGDDTPGDIIAALATAFVALQNLDASRYQEFRALTRRAPAAFLQALENAVLNEGASTNLSWLTDALFETRKKANCWPAIARACRRWLTMYSPAPERKVMVPHSADRDQREKELNKRKYAIEQKVAAFSTTEKALLESLVLETRGDYTKLNKIAFWFLAGGPLQEFGEAFRIWCFAASFNGGFYCAHGEFNDMVQFNRVDWSETRAAMLKAAEQLRDSDISETGRWALVYILQATAAASDAKEATEIIEDLTKDRERPGGWRLIEDWCATDPCDPESTRPDNITATAERYAALDVSQLKKRMPCPADHFFDGARTGLARFEPNAAISTMRLFAVDVVARNIGDFRIAVFQLEKHTAALDDATAIKFVERANLIANNALSEDDKHKELFVASQLGLTIAFPHMAGDAQLATLIAYPKVENILLSLCDLMQDCDPLKYEAALEKAYGDGDTLNQFRLMLFGEYTDTPITNRSKAIVGELIASLDKLVRLSELGLVRRLDDPSLLQLVVASDWNANKLDTVSERLEIWYGSQVLVLAAGRGLISVPECLERIAFSAYPDLVREMGRDAALAVASLFEAALTTAANYDVKASLPDIEQRMDNGGPPQPFNIENKPNPEESVHDSFKRRAETGDVWYERQERKRNAVEKFERELAAVGAQLIIQAVPSDLMVEIFAQEPTIVRRWYWSMMAFDPKALGRVYNVALLVAQVIAREDQAGAVALFDKLTSSNPFVRLTFGLARVSLDAMSVWNAWDGDEMRKLRFKRLDQARTDHDLAMEVLAATRAGKQEHLRDFVLDRRERPEPAHIARAVTVAGLCEDTLWALETIDAHKADCGFLGEYSFV